MKKTFKKTIITLSVIFGSVLLHSCIKDDLTDDSKALKAGDQCPAFSTKDINGQTHNLPDPNKPTVILFFDSECPDCRRQIPVVQQLYDKYKDGCHFIALGREHNEQEVKDYVSREGFTFPFAADPGARIYSKFAGVIVPRVYIVNDRTILLSTTDKESLSYKAGCDLLDNLLRPTE
jgi:hypothetical protein